MSLDNENDSQSTIEPLKLPVVVRTPSPMTYGVRLDNLPWFMFQVIFHTLLEEQRSMSRHPNKYASFPLTLV